MSLEEWQVLIVDDDPAIREEAAAALLHYGIQGVMADSGEEALRLMHNGLRPNVVVSDLRMPNMDGYDLLRAMRANRRWDTIPVVLLVGKDQRPNVPRALELGADGFLVKPFDAEQLLLAIHKRNERTVALIRSDGTQPLRREKPPADSPEAPPPIESVRTRTPPGTVDLSGHGPSSESAGIELRAYWQVITQYKWLILLTTLSALVLTVVISLALTPLYSATSTLRVAAAAGGEIDLGASALAARLSNTYVEIATSDSLLDEMNQRLGSAQEPTIDVAVVPDTELIHITATYPEPEIARDAANILADMMVERSMELFGGDAPTARELLWEQLQQAEDDLNNAIAAYNDALMDLENSEDSTTELGMTGHLGHLELLDRQIALRQGIYAELLQRYENARVNEQVRANSITVSERAYLPITPSSPKLPFNILLGLGGGLTASIILAFFLEGLNNSVRGTEDLDTLSSLPILARVPISPYRMRFWRKRPDIPLPGGFVAEPYHELGVHLLLSQATPAGSLILMTSPEPGTGKSTVSANLGLALAEAGLSVTLVDADLRLPRLHKIFDLPLEPGLNDVLSGEASPEEALHISAWPNLRIMTAGRISTDATGTLAVSKMRALFRSLTNDCEYVILDVPSLHSAAYVTLLAKVVDAVIMVVAQRHTGRDALQNALRQLNDIQAGVLGLVFNRVSRSRSHDYYYYRPRVASRNGKRRASAT